MKRCLGGLVSLGMRQLHSCQHVWVQLGEQLLCQVQAALLGHDLEQGGVGVGVGLGPAAARAVS